MIHMKTATVRQLRTEFPRIEGWLAEGESVVITKHKVVVAELIAPRSAKPNFARRFSIKTQRTPSVKGAVDLLLEERGS
jgi:antitoxin (DNA-binding transcriptional repressor) of toxin-antitoxin stability system